MAVPVSPAAARLLDFSLPMDVTLLDATVAAFYGAGSNEEVLVVPRPELLLCRLHHIQLFQYTVVIIASIKSPVPPSLQTKHQASKPTCHLVYMPHTTQSITHQSTPPPFKISLKSYPLASTLPPRFRPPLDTLSTYSHL